VSLRYLTRCGRRCEVPIADNELPENGEGTTRSDAEGLAAFVRVNLQFPSCLEYDPPG